MKRNKLLLSMNLMDDKYVEEARPAARSKRPLWITLGSIAACLAVAVTSLGLWLFLPFDTEAPDVSRYAGSPYYSLIQKLNAITYVKPVHDNNFELFYDVMADAKNEASEDVAIEDGTVSGTGESYVEATDNQVAGVIEGDLIKRSDRYIYYLDGNTLRVFTIDKENSKEVGSYVVVPKGTYAYIDTPEFYLSEDCSTVTLVQPHSQKVRGEQYSQVRSYVDVVALDVSDPANITEKNRMTISGSYLSGRLVDGKLLLLSSFYVGKNPDFSKEENFLPQIDTGNGFESIPLASIISPETLSSSRYTVVCKLDGSSLSLEGVSAFLSYSNEVYVSTDSVYVTRTYTDTQTSKGIKTQASMTEISRLTYRGDSFEYKGSVSVEGYVKNQYSLDEYDGMLRVVTTTDKHQRTENVSSDGMSVSSSILPGATNANLYCIDLATMQVAATVERFAPDGEIVQSVRFDGTAAYVCTSVQLSDPVFFFDLTDMQNITYKDTGTIEGFSSSLVNFGDGFLLGIGRGNTWDTVKIEVYEESENGVVSVCSYEIERAGYATDYKAYLIDRLNGLVGLGFTKHNGQTDASRYVLLFFDHYDLHELVNVPLEGDNANKRAVYIDGYLYLFGENDFQVEFTLGE